jgi:hypothetical protein
VGNRAPTVHGAETLAQDRHATVGAMDVRVVVSPVAGVFAPVTGLPSTVQAGATLGFVGDVPVVSPFAGELVVMDALAGERLERYQRVAWLNAA